MGFFRRGWDLATGKVAKENKERFEEAQQIVESAKERYEHAVERFEAVKKKHGGIFAGFWPVPVRMSFI